MSRRRHSIIGGNACDTAAKRSKVAGGGGDRRGVACLIIDPQNEFHSGGSLAVPGADAVSGHSLRRTPFRPLQHPLVLLP
jgi:hypothetical protein